MPPQDMPRLVEEALRDLAPYDAQGAVAAHITESLPALKRQARLRSRGPVNRAELSLVVSGGAEARAAAAAAYGKALFGFDLTDGRDEGTEMIVKSAKWRDIIADPAGNPLPFGKALDRLYAEKMDAEGGVLIIDSIYDLPPNTTNATAVDQARNGAYQMLHDLMTEYAEKNYTPVVVLTGDADRLEDFLKKTPSVSQYFTAGVMRVESPPAPPPPPVSVETAAAVTVHRPLKLRKSPGF